MLLLKTNARLDLVNVQYLLEKETQNVNIRYQLLVFKRQAQNKACTLTHS